MDNEIGEIILEARRRAGMTQDQYGRRFEITGPAIFKFEKGNVLPSLDLWLKMADHAGLTRQRAVLLWTRSKLPAAYRYCIEVPDPQAAAREVRRVNRKGGKPDYSKFETREQMLTVLQKDRTLPKPLRDLLLDNDVWTFFKPTGHEINLLRDRLSPLGQGTKTTYADALRLIRQWMRTN